MTAPLDLLHPLDALTPRQRLALAYRAQGFTRDETAAAMKITRTTVRTMLDQAHFRTGVGLDALAQMVADDAPRFAREKKIAHETMVALGRKHRTCVRCGSVVATNGQIVDAPTPAGPVTTCSEGCEAALWAARFSA